MDPKRKAMEGALVPAKRPRNEIVVAGGKENAVVQSGIKRLSSLQAPIMLLSGHEGDIFCCKFSPDGKLLASAGFDRLVYFWNVYGDCENFAVLKGHTGAIMELQFGTDGTFLVTAATDKTLALWDVDVGTRIKKFKGHNGFVNSCNIARRGPQLVCSGSDDGTIKIKKFKGHNGFVNSCNIARRGPQLVCSGSDDGTIKLWDTRKKGVLQSFQNTYQVTCATFSDTAEQVFSGGIDNDIKVWDLRKNDVLYRMRGHSDTVTGMQLSPDGSYLLTNSMDNTVRIWDVRPFAPQERCVKIMQGHQHTFEKNLLRCAWAPDGSKVAAGSGDRFVYVWDTTSRRILYKLPGHAGSVNEVEFHPDEPIVASCGSDKKIFLGEID